MIETEDEARQRRPPPATTTTTTRKRAMDASESTVGNDLCRNWKKEVLLNSLLKHKNAVERQDKQHLVHRISIPLEVKVNPVI